MEIIILLSAGALGALIKEILVDNKLTLPKKVDGDLTLGFLGSLIIGAFVGYMVDGSFFTAAMAGFSGFAIIEQLVPKKNNENISDKTGIEGIIRLIAKNEGVDPDLAVRVAQCESSLSPTATHTNKDESIDRGLFQINNKYHPEVSNAQAFDIVFSTHFFCKAFKEGNLYWWNSSKTCWSK